MTDEELTRIERVLEASDLSSELTDKLIAEVRKLRAALASIQWGSCCDLGQRTDGFLGHCPICMGYGGGSNQPGEHEPDCPIAAALT